MLAVKRLFEALIALGGLLVNIFMLKEQQLRILVILPLYGGSLPIGHYCVTALRDLGHRAEAFSAPDFYPAFAALKNIQITSDRLAYLENSFLQVVSQAILAKVEVFEPDLVLCMAQAPLTHQALKRLRRDNVATAIWFVEDHKLFTYWKAFAPYYDYFAVIQKDPLLSELTELGVRALYLPLAALPSLHQPVEVSAIDQRRYGSDLSFMGAGYPNRRAAFSQLAQLDFKIWGTEWDDEYALAPLVQQGGARISPEEAVKIYNASKINLNLHSSVRAEALVPGGDFVNPRTFELGACRAFQLVDERSLLPDLFAPDELATFRNMDELKSKIDYYLNHEDERLEIAERTRKRVLEEHTYQRRMSTLIEFIKSTREGWPKDRVRDSGVFIYLPDELKGPAAELLTRLNLPADASFADVIVAIKSEQGQLTELETSLLFLDEWKKQYGT